jgi:hypothetical protein
MNRPSIAKGAAIVPSKGLTPINIREVKALEQGLDSMIKGLNLNIKEIFNI